MCGFFAWPEFLRIMDKRVVGPTKKKVYIFGDPQFIGVFFVYSCERESVAK